MGGGSGFADMSDGTLAELRVPAARQRRDDSAGAVAQLGERLLCKQEAVGSIPISSTNSSTNFFSSPIPGFNCSHEGRRFFDTRIGKSSV